MARQIATADELAELYAAQQEWEEAKAADWRRPCPKRMANAAERLNRAEQAVEGKRPF